MKTCFVNAKVILPYGVTDDTVTVENGRIAAVGGDAPRDARVIDCRGLYLSPGFVDIHVHGGGGHGVMDCDPEGILQMAKTHLRHGTTAILPTTLAAPVPLLQKAIFAVKSAMERQTHRTILGVHLEGPFLAPSQKGAQSEDSILAVTAERVRALLDTWEGIRMVGAAPEIENIEVLAKEAKKRGVTLTVAHSDAVFEDCMRAVALGFTDVTHIYSGCSTVTRERGFRRGGVVEAGLLLEALSVTVIADLCHLPSELLALIYKCKGADKLCLITDALEPAGMEMDDGYVYTQKNGVPALYEDGVMKLLDRTAFAGSVATMDVLVRNMKNALGLPIHEAVRMATAAPCAVIGEKNKGEIAPERDADLLLFDEKVQIKYAMVGGRDAFLGENHG